MKTILDMIVKNKNRYIFIILCGLLLIIVVSAHKASKQNEALKAILDDQIMQNMELSQKFEELSDSYSTLEYNLGEQQLKNKELQKKIDDMNTTLQRVEQKID